MITNTDITKLKEVFATKSELKESVTELREEIADVRVELGEVHDKIDSVALAIGQMQNTLDSMVVGPIQDLQNENAAGTIHLARHDQQIEALARGTGIKIPV